MVEGFSPVPEAPGLGFEIDEDALARLAGQSMSEAPRHIGVLRMPGGHTFYGQHYVNPQGEEGTIRGHTSQMWYDDDTAEFERMFERVQSGTVQDD